MKVVMIITLLSFPVLAQALCSLSNTNEISPELSSRSFYKAFKANKSMLKSRGYSSKSMNARKPSLFLIEFMFPFYPSKKEVWGILNHENGGNLVFKTQNKNLNASVKAIIRKLPRCKSGPDVAD